MPRAAGEAAPVPLAAVLRPRAGSEAPAEPPARAVPENVSAEL